MGSPFATGGFATTSSGNVLLWSAVPDSFQEWGVPDGQTEFPAFTSLEPIVLLVARDKWHTLADLPRCTPELLRRPRGREGIVSREVWLQGFGLEISMFEGLCDVSCCLSIFILQLQATAHCGSKGFLHE